eukprot:XP_016872501.1 uncharacterized protein C10orf142-like [Homo sapiens]
MRMYSLHAHEKPSSPSLGTTPPDTRPRPHLESAAGNSEEREPGSLGRASEVGSSSKRPTASMERQKGLPYCTVCGYHCSSPEGTRGCCAVGKVRVAGDGGAPGGGAGMRCCGC